MKEYTNEVPVFSYTLPITETTDVAHPDTINQAPIQAFENTLYNRAEIEKLNNEKGVSGGVPSLDDNGKVPKEQLPDTTNNLMATEAGTALDAVQGKTLDDKGSQMALYIGDDRYLHFRNWENVDTIVPIKIEVLLVEYKTISFGGENATKTIPLPRLPVLVAQYSSGENDKSSFYYKGQLIRKNNMTAVSSTEITIQSSWDAVHDFHCFIAYNDTEIEVKSVTFGGIDTTQTIPLKKKPRLIVQVNNLPTYTGCVGIWYEGKMWGSSNNMRSVTDTEITIKSGWNIKYTFTCYIVYEQ